MRSIIASSALIKCNQAAFASQQRLIPRRSCVSFDLQDLLRRPTAALSCTSLALSRYQMTMTTSSSLQPRALRTGGYGRTYFPQLIRQVVVQCFSGNCQPLVLVDPSELLLFSVQTLVHTTSYQVLLYHWGTSIGHTTPCIVCRLRLVSLLKSCFTPFVEKKWRTSSSNCYMLITWYT